MADEFKRMRQITGTTADWAAHNIVLGLGEIGVERISTKDVRIKVGDGTNPWSVLPYASSADIIGPTVQAALDAKLAKTGGVLTGPLTLAREATTSLEPVSLSQLIAERTAVNAALAGLIHKTGDNMTGPLSLYGDPVGDLEAATRQYVDAADETKINRSGDTMTGPLRVAGAPVEDAEMVSKGYVDNGPYQTVVGGSSTYAGKVVKLNSVGKIDSSLIPTTATYYGTVDLTGIFTLTASYVDGDYYVSSHTGPIDSSWSGKIFGNPTDAGAGQYLIHRQGRWDLVGESAGSTQIEGKVNRSGDTMLGKLNTVASAAGGAGFGLLPGADPTAPANGDIWLVGDTFKVRGGNVTASFKGTNTGDQTITLSGDVTGSGTAGVAATIANNAVTLVKMAQMGTGALLGRSSAGTGNVEAVSFATLKAALSYGIADIAGLQTSLNSKQPYSNELTVIAGLTGTTGLLRKTAAGAWELDVNSYSPTSHTHTTAQVTGLDAALAGKASAIHSHAIGDVTNLQSTLDAKANLNNPIFTGAPQTTTAAAYSDNLVIANTRQVLSTVTTVPESFHNTSYTLTLLDAGRMVTMQADGNAIVLTVPPASSVNFPVGTRIDLIHWWAGAGSVTIAPGAGVTIQSAEGKLKLRTNYSAATLWKHSADLWVLIGDLA